MSSFFKGFLWFIWDAFASLMSALAGFFFFLIGSGFLIAAVIGLTGEFSMWLQNDPVFLYVILIGSPVFILFIVYSLNTILDNTPGWEEKGDE